MNKAFEAVITKSGADLVFDHGKKGIVLLSASKEDGEAIRAIAAILSNIPDDKDPDEIGYFVMRHLTFMQKLGDVIRSKTKK